MRTKKIWLAAVVIAVLAVALVIGDLWLDQDGGSSAPGGRIRVSATFYPMAEFARQVGGDRVEVTTLISPGIEPHDYDPTPQQTANIYKSQLFIYNGAGLEPWADKITGDLKSEGVIVVEASEGIDLMSKGSATDVTDDPADAFYPYDPHVWLDPVLAAREVDNIKEGLIEADPGNRETYEANAEAYKQRLSALDQAFRDGLADCAGRETVTSHQAFRYLANRYNLDNMAISGLSPNEDPSPQKLAEVARFVEEHDIRYIFFETLVSPKLADTIASETGAGTLVLNPLEGLTEEDIARGRDYITVQEENLANLKTALDCK